MADLDLLEHERDELVRELNAAQEQFELLNLTEAPNAAGPVTPPPANQATSAIASPPTSHPTSPPATNEPKPKRKVDKTAKSPQEATKLGIPFISRLFGNDKRLFPLKKSLAKHSELSNEAIIALRLDIKDSEIQQKDKLIHAYATKASRLVINELRKTKYDSNALRMHYRVSRTKIHRVKSESFARDQVLKERKGRKPVVTPQQVDCLL